MATTLKEGFQDRKFRIPAGDPLLRADLHAVKSQVGLTGIRRLVADGDTDGHADRFWAAALCATAANLTPESFGYQGVPGTRSRFAPPDQDDDEQEGSGSRWGDDGGTW